MKKNSLLDEVLPIVEETNRLTTKLRIQLHRASLSKFAEVDIEQRHKGESARLKEYFDNKDKDEYKYYTPKIEEFYIGFEFESNYSVLNQGKISDKWRKFTLTENELWFWDAYTQDAYKTEFRVKYLDEEDILELGFKKQNFSFWDGHTHYIYKDKDLGDRKSLYHKWGTSQIIIEYPSGKERYFQGEIKNKSELKKLMKQLNITSAQH